MKIKPKEVKATVGVLTSPTATAMGIVDHGANQTPWNAVKRDRITHSSDKENDVTIKAGKGSKKGDLFVTQLTFSKSLFPTQADVTKYMTEKGYDGFDIVDDQDAWAAKSTESTDGLTLSAKSRTQPTKDTGVTISAKEVEAVGEAKTGGAKVTPAAEAVAEEEVEAQAAAGDPGEEIEVEETDTVLEFPPETAEKYDMWASYMSDEGSLLGVLKDGMDYDAVPPGVDDVMGALYYTTGNILGGSGTLTEKQAALKQAGEDFATLTSGLYELFTQATKDAADTKSAHHDSAKRFVKSFKEAEERAKAMKGTERFGNVTEPVEAPKAADPVVVQPAAEPQQAPASDVAVLAAIKGMENRLGRRISNVERKANAATAAALAVKTEADTQRNRSPTKKSLAAAAGDFDLTIAPIDTATEEAKAKARKARMEELGGMFGRTGGRANAS